jgi:hypothetical protein
MPTMPTQPGQVFTKTSLAATPQVRKVFVQIFF